MEYHIPTQNQVVSVEALVNRKLRNSMLWMVWGLLTTAIIGFMAVTNSSWLRFAHSNFSIILLAEVAVVFLFSFRQHTASSSSIWQFCIFRSSSEKRFIRLRYILNGICHCTTHC